MSPFAEPADGIDGGGADRLAGIGQGGLDAGQVAGAAHPAQRVYGVGGDAGI